MFIFHDPQFVIIETTFKGAVWGLSAQRNRASAEYDVASVLFDVTMQIYTEKLTFPLSQICFFLILIFFPLMYVSAFCNRHFCKLMRLPFYRVSTPFSGKSYCISSDYFYCYFYFYYFPAIKKWFEDLWKNFLIHDIVLFEK
jgi:hypothetical protein